MEQEFQLASEGKLPKRGRKAALGRLMTASTYGPNKDVSETRVFDIDQASAR
jgi:hypothetical protein